MPLDLNNSKGELVIDPYKYEQKFKKWDRRIKSISNKNEKIIVKYIMDMRNGENIYPKAVKGKRGYHRLMSQRHRLKRISELLERDYGIKNMAVIEKEDIKKLEISIKSLFERMEEGEIKKKDGKKYRSLRDYIQGFKAFWHWYMTYIKKERDLLLPDITEYITAHQDRKPQFVYFGEVGSTSIEEGFKKLLNAAKPHYKTHLAFLFDSGIRTPTEFMNIKRKDITPMKDTPYFWLNIRDEISKTFGRRIKLMLCYELLKDYLETTKFKPDEFIFKISPSVFNQYIKRLGERVLGKKGITMYDFRHNSACYWLPRYTSESALMYRFGWKNSKMIYYYSEFLGMKDTIQEEDMMIDVTKADLQKQLEQERKGREVLQDQITAINKDMENIKINFVKSLKSLVKKGEIKTATDIVIKEGLVEELRKVAKS